MLQYGLIAEEVAKVYPELVAYDKEGKPYTVRYQYITTMLLNEVQKQYQRAEKQSETIETEQQQIKAQQQEIESLKQQLQVQNATLQERLSGWKDWCEQKCPRNRGQLYSCKCWSAYWRACPGPAGLPVVAGTALLSFPTERSDRDLLAR